MHILRQVYPIQLVQHLLETVHKRKLTHYYNCLLGPNFLKLFNICPLELPLQASSWLLVEEQASAVRSFAHIIRKYKAKRLGSLVVAM